MERVLFYLPVVTPWWFANIVVHMIRALSASAEVHVLVPPLWRNTGVGLEQLQGCTTISGVYWHLADGSGHESLRRSPADPDALVEFVQAIDPTHVLCRSADIATPSRFPGKVRHLMEAGASPLSTRAGWIILQQDFWHHGQMPDLSGADRAAIEQAVGPIWMRMRQRAEQHKAFQLPREEILRNMGLPVDRKIIALPLQYEHEEAFTFIHNRIERNLDLIRYVAERVDGEAVVAVTDHPLNYRHVDNSEVYEAIAALGERAHLVPNPNARYDVTDLLIKHCDGLIVQNSKAIYSGAFFRKPTLRLSQRPTASWLGAHDNFEAFRTALASGDRNACDDHARLWWGYHILHEIIDPVALSGDELLNRLNRPFSPDRLAAGLKQYELYQRELDSAA